ncbi:hypothetical protein VP1G_05465 [Cytospora mali]|uniref:DUF7924 domain-containing protein n=1 Tax=Cytospora mali TaxID=578113 RepID=A0A194V2N0_CYTMA|nr:hypothetical protein VP1G_05465 [Valsa mali var. pyri (nom. inval.)]
MRSPRFAIFTTPTATCIKPAPLTPSSTWSARKLTAVVRHPLLVESDVKGSGKKQGPSGGAHASIARLCMSRRPFVGTPWDESYFAATWYMYFPFLTCEVKCGALDIADRQNAHSATLAVRAVVELFRLVKREKEINREILAFSVSHDCSNIRIYGHYPLEGKEKWTAYRFTRNVYDNWMPDHFKRICSAIESLPADINFDISQESELQFSSQNGPSQELDGQYLSQSEGSASVSSVAHVDHTTPDTSMSQSFKKPRRR